MQIFLFKNRNCLHCTFITLMCHFGTSQKKRNRSPSIDGLADDLDEVFEFDQSKGNDSVFVSPANSVPNSRYTTPQSSRANSPTGQRKRIRTTSETSTSSSRPSTSHRTRTTSETSSASSRPSTSRRRTTSDSTPTSSRLSSKRNSRTSYASSDTSILGHDFQCE